MFIRAPRSEAIVRQRQIPMRALFLFLLFWGLSTPGAAMAAPEGYEEFARTKSFVFYARPDPPKAFYTLTEEAEGFFAPIARAVGYEATERTEVILTLDHASFVALGNPSYAIGIARPQKNQMMIALRDRRGQLVDFYAVFRHEASHIALLRAARGENAGEIPRWFVEGFAEWQAKEHSLAQDNELLAAARGGNLLPLAELEQSFPNDDTLIGRAYAQSAAFVRFMVQVKGEAAFAQAVSEVSQGKSFGVAMRNALGKSLGELEDEFFHGLQQQASWLQVLTDPNFIWGLVLVLFLWVYVKKRREFQNAMRALKDEDFPPPLPSELVFLSFAPVMLATPTAEIPEPPHKVLPAQEVPEPSAQAPYVQIIHEHPSESEVLDESDEPGKSPQG